MGHLRTGALGCRTKLEGGEEGFAARVAPPVNSFQAIFTAIPKTSRIDLPDKNDAELGFEADHASLVLVPF